MTALTIQDVSRRSGLSEPTLPDHGDPDAEAQANLRVQGMYPRLAEVVLR